MVVVRAFGGANGATIVEEIPAGLKMSAGRIPSAKAAASDAGRLAANEDMIFFKNL